MVLNALRMREQNELNGCLIVYIRQGSWSCGRLRSRDLAGMYIKKASCKILQFYTLAETLVINYMALVKVRICSLLKRRSLMQVLDR